MKRAICLYLHVHQPYRVKHFSVMQIGNDHNYFNDETPNQDTNNRFIIDKVSEKSYLVTNAKLLQLLNRHEDFKLSLSISGTLIDQLQQWRPDVLESFQRLTQTGRVEILAETYYHSLAFFYSRNEFEDQVAQHKQKVQDVFNQDPQVFRNTELSYNNDLAYWADNQGYKGIITEGWDPVLGWRSPNFVYQPTYTQNIKLLMKNYRLSDDIAFRFSDHDWPEWPLTADKFVHWLESIPQDQPLINLFMDYETFGEHQWHDTGIFEFLDYLPDEFMKQGEGRSFMTISEAIDHYEPVDRIDVPQTITWADTERDLTAWLGNTMQQQAIGTLYDMRERVLGSNDNDLIYDWRRLQTSDHFYYMCTKWFKDGDVHAYFSPYSSPYEAFMNIMNALHDIEFRLVQTTSR